MASPLKVLVVYGGDSSERDVSIISGKNVAAALRKAGQFQVSELDLKKPEITPEMQEADVIYPVLHGGFGEDGRIQALMEKAGLRFVGCPSEACRICMDKWEAKKMMDKAGIRNAPGKVVTSPETPCITEYGFPVIVKPTNEGSTFGLSRVESPDQWKAAMNLGFRYGDRMLVETFIDGTEATVSVLDGKALPAIEIRYPGKCYDYDAKYTHAQGETQYLCPPVSIPEASLREAAELSEKFYRVSGARDQLRVDIIVDKEGKCWVLEGNTIPGCTESSLLPKAAKAAGIPFTELCTKLVLLAAGR